MALAGIGLYLIFKPKAVVVAPTPGGGDLVPIVPPVQPIVPIETPIDISLPADKPVDNIQKIVDIISPKDDKKGTPIDGGGTPSGGDTPIDGGGTPSGGGVPIQQIFAPRPLAPGDPGFIETWNGEPAVVENPKTTLPVDNIKKIIEIITGGAEIPVDGGAVGPGNGGGGEMPGGGSTGGGTPSGGYIDVPPVFGGGDINITPGGGNIFDQPIIDNPTPVIVEPNPVYIEPAPVSSGGGETYNTPVYNEPSTNNILLGVERGGGESFWESLRNSQWIQQIGGEEAIADPLSFDLIDRPLDQA